MPRELVIYGLIDPRDGTIRYIGRTIDPARRFYEHLRNKNPHESTAKRAWIVFGCDAGWPLLNEQPRDHSPMSRDLLPRVEETTGALQLVAQLEAAAGGATWR